MQMPEDFKEFIALMNSHGVRYVMIGGFAYNLYRNPRATGDIDFMLSVDDENEKNIRKVLVDFGFGETLPETNVLVPGKVLMLGRSPFRIDLLNQITGVTFAEVEETARVLQVQGLSVPVISPELLLKNKESTGREKDRLDARELRVWLDSQHQ